MGVGSADKIHFGANNMFTVDSPNFKVDENGDIYLIGNTVLTNSFVFPFNCKIELFIELTGSSYRSAPFDEYVSMIAWMPFIVRSNISLRMTYFQKSRKALGLARIKVINPVNSRILLPEKSISCKSPENHPIVYKIDFFLLQSKMPDKT